MCVVYNNLSDKERTHKMYLFFLLGLKVFKFKTSRLFHDLEGILVWALLKLNLLYFWE